MFKMRAKMISVGLLGAAVMLPLNLAKADQLGHASWSRRQPISPPMASTWTRTS